MNRSAELCLHVTTAKQYNQTRVHVVAVVYRPWETAEAKNKFTIYSPWHIFLLVTKKYLPL